jgi:ornithine carbamoyltransferase
MTINASPNLHMQSRLGDRRPCDEPGIIFYVVNCSTPKSMQNRQEILQQLLTSKSKGRSVKLKISHEPQSFVADIDYILTDKEVVMLKPVDAERQALRRTSYYVDEIEKVEKVGFLADLSMHLLAGGVKSGN